MRAFLTRIPDRMLTVGAVLGTIVLVATAVALAAGVRPVFLRSGSMAPTMPTGSLVLVRQVAAADLVVGDVVCVRSGGARVTHRITNIRHTGSEVFLTLKGDANASADAEPYQVSTAYRTIAHVPWLGYLLGYVAGAATSPLGIFLLGTFVMAMLMLIVRGGSSRPRTPPTPPSGGGRRRGARRPVKVAVGALFLLVGPGQVAGAWAAPWTDPVPISGTTLTAGTIPAPATFTCGGLGLLSVTFNWAAVAGATDYTLHYGSGGSTTVTVTGTSRTIVTAISGGTAWVRANRVFPSTTWTSVASNTRSYTVALVSLCS
jgi:signal peptidase I